MRAMKVMEASGTEWASPTLFVTMKKETLRARVYYEKLSAGSARASYSLLRIECFIGSL